MEDALLFELIQEVKKDKDLNFKEAVEYLDVRYNAFRDPKLSELELMDKCIFESLSLWLLKDMALTRQKYVGGHFLKENYKIKLRGFNKELSMLGNIEGEIGKRYG